MKCTSKNSKKYLTKSLITFVCICASVCALFIVPHIASAHEVYVLNSSEINQALTTPSINPLDVIEDNIGQFTFWAFLSIAIVFLVFFMSVTRFLENKLDPVLIKIKKYAPLISRVTVGLSFLAGAYYQASYGPELPLAAAYGIYTPYITILLVAIGIMITFGLYVRFAALVALTMYFIAVYNHGWYMLTYTNYLGEILLLILVGAHTFNGKHHLKKSTALHTVGKNPIKERIQRIQKTLAPMAPAVLRVFFGIALIYTSAYAKLIHSNLAYETVLKYHLTNYLHFDPRFLVLGAACIEIVIGLFFALGIEIRFTALFMCFWLTQSLLFFGETVWPHIILFGIPIAFICYGYDKYSLEGYFFKKGDREPVL